MKTLLELAVPAVTFLLLLAVGLDLNLRQIRIHDLRHTYATLLLQTGAPIT